MAGKQTKGKSPSKGKAGTARAAVAQNGEHVGEIQVQAAEESPQAPVIRLVEVVQAELKEPAGPVVLPDEAVREAAAPDPLEEAVSEPEPAEPGEGEAHFGEAGPSDGEDGEEAEPAAPTQGLPGPAIAGPASDQLADVMAHLLFHQALIRDADAESNIQRYMDLARDFRQGVHVVLDNPFDKAIAIVFELVIEERMNPWDIDLRQFSSLYLGRVRGEAAVDFIAAGKLMLMAWSILKAQTDEVISAIQRIEAQRKAEEDAAMAAELGEGAPFSDDQPWLSADETTYNFTRAVIEANPLEIAEAVHPPAERPVTLYDLIHAFEEAKDEGATRMILEEERAKARAELERTRKAKVSGMMHAENLEEEIAATWMRILERINREESPAALVPLDALHDGSREDYLTVFISSLFLAFNQRITVKQSELPRGPILLQLTPQAQKGHLPPMPVPVVAGAAVALPSPGRRGKRPKAAARKAGGRAAAPPN